MIPGCNDELNTRCAAKKDPAEDSFELSSVSDAERGLSHGDRVEGDQSPGSGVEGDVWWR